LEFLSQKSVDRRFKRKSPINITDIPVSQIYLNQVAKVAGLFIINRSKWLNAIEIKTNGKTSVIDQLRQLPCVAHVEFLGRIKDRAKPSMEAITETDYQKAQELAQDKKDALTASDYGKALVQNRLIGINELQKNNMADRMHIAVFDAGFFNAYKVKGMEDLLLPDVITKDFVDYDNSVWEDDRHGANVLSFMKTWNPGTYIGSAPLAHYTLIRTENPTSEYPTEEVNWLFAAEFADSIGADLIVSSLGYHTFDDSTLSHTYAQLDGQSSIIAKAANFAYIKGMMVVTSAGNEGMNKWHRIGTPSDAAGVIGIGACDENGFYVKFSSLGPSADKRVKPDFLALGYKAMVASPNGLYAGNGTSYSTPIFGGGMACLMQACPDKTFDEIRQALVMSSTHHQHPDSAYGNGLPDFNLALNILGYFNPQDTISDYFYTKTTPVFFQDLGIHFRSKSSQTVKISIKGQRKKKLRNLFHDSYRLKPGEWIHEEALFTLYNQEIKKKRKHKLSTLILIIETENGTIQKTIRLSYD